MAVKTIVLAKVEDEWIVDQGAPPARVDLGERHKMRRVPRAVACVWLNRGEDSDVDSARMFARKNGYLVFTYPTDEKDPLGRAKAAALAGDAARPKESRAC